ncbi:YhdP family protein [Stutzerimonas stutzeri]|uniref:YhdP family protein n=1 Tax=Stutzerimonas sp. S1 TaxID=3030652 RepID=UPI00222549DE|nr:YhdP family protein [Stutzerimonas sp. S1]MCW3149818.1 YhdP family protein [Stutzerimonas sp. S1]
MNRLVSVLGSVLRQLLLVGALGLVAAAFYVSLGRQLVPLVAEYRQEAQNKAAELLSMPVTLGRLEGHWEGFAPRLLAHDVLLGEGAAAMHLDRLVVIPDLPASLWAREVRLASLQFDGARLSLVQDAGGQWRIEGLPARDNQPPPDPAKLLLALQKIRSLALLDSQLTLQPYGESPLTLTYTNLSLQVGGRDLRLDGRTVLPDGQPLALQIKARVEPERWQQAAVELYLSLPQSDWAAWLPKRLTGEWHFDRLRAGGEAWASWQQQALTRAVLRLDAPQISAAFGERPSVQVDNLALTAYAQRDERGYRLLVDELAFNQGETRWGDARLIAEQDERARSWHLQVDRVGIAPLATLAQALAPLPESAGLILADLAPRGTLRALQADYRPELQGPERLQFAARLDDVTISAHHWIPAAENVSGSIQGDLGSGELRIDSEDFSLHLTPLFAEPWRYRHARGRLRWSLDEQAFTLAAPYLRLDGEEGQIAGDFLIRLRRDPAEEDYMDLRVGLSQGDARYTAKYLPTRSPALSPALSEWLQTAIRGGAIEQGYFQYQGALNKDAGDAARNLSLYFKVSDAELAYQPGWPNLHDARGEVLIEDSGVRVRLSEGRILDSRLQDASADIPHAEPGAKPQLAIRGQLQSSVGDGLKILREAPLGTAELFAGWQGEGALDGSLDLLIPLAKGEAPRVAVDFTSSAATLQIDKPDLQFDKLSGHFRYDSEKGFSASDIHAQTFGRTVRGSAVATGSRGSPATRIEAQGSITLERLAAWLNIQPTLPARGELPYQLRLNLAGADSQLQLDSSLQGLAIELPEPFGKAAGERRDTSLRMTLQGAERRYVVQHADLASLNFAAPAEDWRAGRGELRLGAGAAALPTAKGLRVRGRLARLDWSAWQAVRERQAAAAEGPAVASLLRDAQLSVDRFEGFGTRIDGLGVELRRVADAWALNLRSDLITGAVRLPDAEGAPIVANLQRLRLPASEPGTAPAERADPLADVDPSRFPALDVSIAEVLQGDALLGQWSLTMRPVVGGVTFPTLELNLKGLRINGSGGWREGRSWYKGRLAGGNLADVLLAWGFAPSTTSESFRMDVDGSWPGSPAWFGVGRFTGSMEPRLRNGQFVEVEGSAQALRVFGLLNFNSIGRRLRLDFSDLFGKGFSYDRVGGLLQASDGVYRTREPITVTGPSSNLELNGKLDLVHDRIDAKLLVTLPVSNNLPLAALIVGAPAIGGALFVVDKLLGDKVARFASVQYNVEGPWQSPKITFDKPFEKPN